MLLKRVLCLPVLLAAATVTVSAVPAAADQGSRSRQETRIRTEIVGVVDQKEGKFFVAGDEQMNPIANLRGVGFSEDNFARFLGMRVRITGEMVTEGNTKTLNVHSLNDIVRIWPEESKK